MHKNLLSTDEPCLKETGNQPKSKQFIMLELVPHLEFAKQNCLLTALCHEDLQG